MEGYAGRHFWFSGSVAAAAPDGSRRAYRDALADLDDAFAAIPTLQASIERLRDAKGGR